VANNGQGIVLCSDGTLLDGQHRLAAVVLAQVTVAMLVVRNAPKDAFITMDSGKSRSLRDVLAIEGYANTPAIAGAARAAYGYAAGTNISYPATRSVLEAFVRAHPYLVKAGELVSGQPRFFSKIPLAAIIFLANESRQYDNEIASFLEGLFSGEGLFKGDPRLTLREWFSKARIGSRITTLSAFSVYARAWNAYAKGRELTFLRALDAPTLRNLPIIGFARSTYTDVPDLAARKSEISAENLRKNRPRSNLPTSLATPALRELVDA
jgi:hypothetical protein